MSGRFFSKHYTNNYKDLLTNNPIGGIIIIPLNFFCSIRNMDIELRKKFLNTYVITQLNKGIAPIYEPDLDNRIKTECALSNLQFTNDLKTACNYADVFWVTYDTPVDDNDMADNKLIYQQISDICNLKSSAATIIISSQIVATTCARLEKDFPQHTFVYIPENLRFFYNIQSIMFFEEFCKSNNIKLIWGFWDKESETFINELKEIYNDSFLNFIELNIEDNWKPNFKTGENVYLNENCHSDKKNLKDFHFGLDRQLDGFKTAHMGVHQHIHIAENFYSNILSKE
mgnify:CR=1 FL=1